ncbi:HAD family phosphatase [Iamia sp. SCSIO 61187]|uniref:HAD family hydrolase n=1 Tax=Iamia sp. SCSIO 61187 TaxID=2722752 RepID=UPI001C6387D9|nr:HAD-IB family hydrolase [Iamia sp. SCSIO 61187]
MEAAFFDLDKTVIAKASMVAFGKPLYRAGLLNRWILLRALSGQLVYLYLGADEERMARMRTKVLALTAGWDQAQMRAVVAATLEEVIDPIVFDEAVDLIAEHQAAGRRVFIISASPEEIVVPLARHLGVDEAIATRARVDDRGRYTGEVAFYAYGVHKAERMEEVAAERGIDLAASYAYSDSITDVPMLEAVGHPVAVNPDRDLAKVAADRGWEVRWFTRKVPLRERVAMPSPGPTAAVGGGLLATGAAGATAWWWLRRDRSVQETAHQAAGLARLVGTWAGPVAHAASTTAGWLPGRVPTRRRPLPRRPPAPGRGRRGQISSRVRRRGAS